MPTDVTGTSIYNRATTEFEFRPGPIFANVLLADEINRAPPKTQAALLEAMEERQVTIEGDTHPLPRPFLVVATQNPIEYEGRTRCPRPSSTASCSGSARLPRRDDEGRILRGMERETDDHVLGPVSKRGAARAPGRGPSGVQRRGSPLHRRPRATRAAAAVQLGRAREAPSRS